ncbi:MAG: hypothetical protein A2W80_00855 [Candidatus Riflebacteria bacterium GWC2_50_8]|nr:MAG: hypothetical protein A2W80_00855 [Candidatus Riflebacteria bacterium GWC2_50_8]
MSVVWRPPRRLLPILALFLCLVSTMVLVAQQDEVPAAAALQSEMTEITADVIGDDGEAVTGAGESQSSGETAVPAPDAQTIPELSVPQAAAAETAGEEPAAQIPAPAVVEPAATVEPATSVVADPVVVPDVDAPAAEPVAATSEAPAAEPDKPAAVAVAVAEPAKEPAVTEELNYFDMERANVLVVILTLMAFVSYYTFHAQRGKELFIRRISGLSALEDAVGRATEMGRGVLYIPGIMDMDDIQTIAGVTIMGHVAKKTAEYDTPLFAPMTRSFVMSVAQEIVKQSYLEKGRPDAYRPDRINYLTDDQFGYVAGVGGIMMREKPAACFYLGTFYAESLILAETGNAVGAIQIAGTAEPSQIPFFVAACDYTLIGEELFAASAYLSKNPKEVGSLKGQDMIKLLIIAVMVIGTLLVTIAKTEYGAGTVFASLAENFMRLLK